MPFPYLSSVVTNSPKTNIKDLFLFQNIFLFKLVTSVLVMMILRTNYLFAVTRRKLFPLRF